MSSCSNSLKLPACRIVWSQMVNLEPDAPVSQNVKAKKIIWQGRERNASAPAEASLDIECLRQVKIFPTYPTISCRLK